jgi:predicted DNA-binding transcriptional regulator YafY
MNRIDRLTAILLKLQTQRIVRGKEIAERFGISLRTVYRDIRALEDAGVPIGSEAGRGYFLAEGFHLPPIMFTPEEANSLLLGSKLIEKFSDMSVNRYFAGAMDKIKLVLGRKESEHLNTLSSFIEVLKTAPGSREGFPNDLLAEIQAALGCNRVIGIEYTSGYKEETTRRMIEPLGLCFYAAFWHLLAYCRLRGDYRDFRVDRIRSVTTTAHTFDTHRHGDLKDIIRRTVYSTDLKPATVRFDQPAARFARDQKYYFGFVEQKQIDDRIEMYFLTASYEGIARWLLSFVDAVEVVSPEPLKAVLHHHARRLYEHHN